MIDCAPRASSSCTGELNLPPPQLHAVARRALANPIQMSVSAKSASNRLLWRMLFRLRPAPLASTLKQAFGVRRQAIAIPSGRFWVDPVSNFGQRLLVYGSYEPAMTQVLLELLRPGDSCIDIGANEGWFAIQAARAVGSTGTIVAVEPQSRLQPVLKANRELNQVSNMTVVQAAIGVNGRKADLFLAPDVNTGSSGMTRHTRYSLSKEVVPSLSLMKLLEMHGVSKVDVLKVDVEGHEYDVLMESKPIFEMRKVRHLLIEFHPTILRQRGLSVDELISFLKACGYSNLQPNEFHWRL